MRRIIFLGFVGIAAIGAASLFLAPETASAQGLVPCGGEAQSPCSLCHLFKLLHNILEFILTIVVPIVAAFLFAWGGFIWLSSMGNPARVKQGQQILLATVVGILIVYSAWLFISLIFQSFGVITFTGTGKWWEIDCEIILPPSNLTLEASPQNILSGESATLTWQLTTPANTCMASGAWGSGSKNPAGGTESVSPSSGGAHTYELTCARSSGTETVSATVNVQALVAAPGNVFVTSQDYTGNLGGIAGANAKCQNLAASKGYGGTWIAWVSIPGNNARDRIPDRPFINFNGETIANGKGDLLDGPPPTPLQNPIRYDESGNTRATLVWTGTSPAGTGPAIFLPDTHFCSNWTSGNNFQAGITGDSVQTGDAWTYTPLSTLDPLTCDKSAALYCFLTP